MQLRFLFLFTIITFAMPAATLQKSDFGKTADGASVALYTLKNSKGMEARIITYGGAIVSLKTPDRTGAMADIVLGYDTLADYLGWQVLLRSPHRPLWQSHRARKIHARRQILQRARQQWRKLTARRHPGLRQTRLDRARTARWRARTDL